MAPYGKLKVDTLTWDNSGSDTDVTISSLAAKADLNSPTFTGTPTVPGYATLSSPTFIGTATFANIQVDGTTTTVNSSTMTVADKNIEIAKGAANDAAADGAGITVDSGDGDKTWNWVDATDAWTSSEHIHLGDTKKLFLGTGTDLQIYYSGTSGWIYQSDSGNDVTLGANAGNVWLRTGASANDDAVKCVSGGTVELYHSGTKKFETTAAGVTVTGTVSDTKGDVRKIPQQNEQGSAHTLVAADSGKHILADAAVTVPPTSGIFSSGDAVTIINAGSADISIARGTGVTLYNSADASNADRTLSAKGMATLLCAGVDTYYISGAGLS